MGIAVQLVMDVTMKHILILIFTVSVTKCGISIPKEDCRWITASDWNTELKCDGDQVAVGACSGGGGWGHKDCPGGTVHQLLCCSLPDYTYSHCNTYSSDWGVGIDCRDHGDETLMEGGCNSGENHDCHGSANLVTCCDGAQGGEKVGPTDECTWEYSGHGTMLECGRTDEVLVGRCGSGKGLDCPGGTSHGILCCELDFISASGANQTIVN